MGRIYTATFEDVAVVVLQDLFEILLPADLIVLIHALHITKHDDADNENLSASLRFIPATETSGTGGTSVTPRKGDEGDVASSCTVEANNMTTLATSSGSIEEKWPFGFNMVAGLHYIWTPETRPVLSPSSMYVIRLDTAPAASTQMNGILAFEEIGG